MSTERRALWFVAPGEVTLRRDPRKDLGEGKVRVDAIVSGISRGTELLLYKGEGPEPFDPSLDAEGTPTYPRRYGYAWVGKVEESRSPLFAAGDRVLGLLPHGDTHEVLPDRLRAVPPGIPPARATLGPLVETAITCVWDTRIAFGERVAVLGGGALGLLVALLAKRVGALVHLVERSRERRRIARAVGVEKVHASARGAEASFDAVIEATGDPAGLDDAIRLASVEARIVVASFYGKRTSPVELGDAFHRRRLSLVSSQVSRIPAFMAPRWDADRKWALVFDLLGDPALDALVTDRVPFDDAPAHYAALAADPTKGLFSVLVYK